MISYIKKIITGGNSRSVAVKKNIIGSFLIKGISIIVSLLLVPLTLGYVSSEIYGIWLTISSIMVWLGFFDVGFTLGLKNKLAEAIAQDDWQRGKALVSTTYFMMVLIFIPLCLILEIIIPHINWANFLNVKEIYNDAIIKALYVLAACFCLQMIVNVLTAVIAAHQKVALSSSFPVIGNILSLLVIFILTKTCPPSLMALAFALSLMPVIVVFFASILLYHKNFKKVAPNIKTIERKYIKDIFNLGASFFIIQLQVVILFQCTNILISNISGPEDVTAYNISYKYIGIAMMAYTIILSPLWPAFTDAYTKRDFGWMNSVYRKMTKVYLLSVVIMIIMVAVSPIAYKLWIGDKANIPFLMTTLVAVYMMINNWDSLQVNLINGIGTIKLQLYVTLIGLVLHIPLSLFLGRYIGAYGVISSMIFINIIYSVFFTIQINKILKQKASGVWIK